MSEFDDMLSSALGEAIDFIGAKPFTIGADTFTGDLSELGQDSFAIVQGGKEIVVTATIVAPIAQFGDTPPAAGTRLKCQGRAFVIAATSSDPISLTLQLAAADAH